MAGRIRRGTLAALARVWGVSRQTLANEHKAVTIAKANDAQFREIIMHETQRVLNDAKALQDPIARVSNVRATLALLMKALPARVEVTGAGGVPLALPPELQAIRPTQAELAHLAMTESATCDDPECRVHKVVRALLSSASGG
jgi:galactokinase